MIFRASICLIIKPNDHILKYDPDYSMNLSFNIKSFSQCSCILSQPTCFQHTLLVLGINEVVLMS